ncbi:hypothetical protein [Sphingomonas sp. SUN039]|uniref:hypothetical protein n=1 Tax=Sphingomonas sp. SUN039 TaxID=2937787 RepID=UPI0021643090|nr:hypothetical protein [Sphingomonas sp. SUN039]UVO55749.1 hypothetical protein M0209_17120 [Sphingomonas sp. SUN039]
MAALLMAVTPASATQADRSLHTLTIRSSQKLEIRPKAEEAWYQSGNWPLIGTGITLIITNGIAIGLIYLQSSRSFNALLRQRKIERLSASLNDFYNPLLALLDVNKEIFDQTGPSSFPLDENGRTAAAMVWKHTKKRILANNLQIESILSTKTHLMDETDSLEHYHRLLVHVAMYETFQTVRTDLYQRFFFPPEARTHIVAKRNLVLEKYNSAVGEQI